MIYTSQGLFTAADLADYDEQHDTGTLHVELADPPPWWSVPAEPCACGQPWELHESVTVLRADGEVVIACTLFDGTTWHEPDPEPYDPSWM